MGVAEGGRKGIAWHYDDGLVEEGAFQQGIELSGGKSYREKMKRIPRDVSI